MRQDAVFFGGATRPQRAPGPDFSEFSRRLKLGGRFFENQDEVKAEAAAEEADLPEAEEEMDPKDHQQKIKAQSF